MATAADVERTLKTLIKHLNDADAEAKKGLPDERAISCVVTDLGASYRAVYRAGKMGTLTKTDGAVQGDVVFRVSSDDLVSLVEGRLSLPVAMLTGRLRVDAGPRDLMLLRRMF